MSQNSIFTIFLALVSTCCFADLTILLSPATIQVMINMHTEKKVKEDKSTEVNRTLLNDALVCQESQDSDFQRNNDATAGADKQNAGVEGNSGATAGADMQNAGTEGSRNAVENEEILYERQRNQVSGPDNVDGATGGHERQNNMNEDSDNLTTAPEQPTARPGGTGDEEENEMFNRQNAYQHYTVMRSVRESSAGFLSVPSESDEDFD